jgi:hypothetical protein
MLITVSAISDFWTVRCDGVAGDMMFLSGAQAELAARRLGARLAAAGLDAEIRIFDRRGQEVGRFVGAPPPAPRPGVRVLVPEAACLSLRQPQARAA